MQLLGSVLANKSATILRDIQPDLLFKDNREEQRVYDFIREYFDEHRVLPTETIVSDNTGIMLPDTENQPVEYYMRRTRQRAMFQGVTDPYNRLQDALQSPRTGMAEAEEAIEELYALKMRFMNSGTGIETSDTVIEEIRNDVDQMRWRGGLLNGITTGWGPLDLKMDGYNRDDLVVWVGRPGRAKSWLLLNQCHAAWTAGYKPLYISMEMGAKQNMRRLIGIHSGINPTFIKKGQLSTPGKLIFNRATDELLLQRPLHMVTANFTRTVDQIANFIDEYRPDICYIDAGYLLTPKKKRYGSGGRRETISDVIEELKELGANTGIPIVITVQFNRNAEQRRRGSNSRRADGDGGNDSINPIAHLSIAEIGETDVIGQAASHVLGIEFPPYPLRPNDYRVFGFLKGREGEDGWWLSKFIKTQHSPVDMSLVPLDDPVYDIIRQGGNNARRRPPGQRSAAMAIQDEAS